MTPQITTFQCFQLQVNYSALNGAAVSDYYRKVKASVHGGDGVGRKDIINRWLKLT